VRVIFDQSLEQVSSPWDTSFEGMSDLSRLLSRHGCSVEASWRPLEETLRALTGPGQVMVLGIPWGAQYSDAARAALDRFMRAGGGVLVISEHDNIYGNATAQNALTERYGVITKAAHAQTQEQDPKSANGRWTRVTVAEPARASSLAVAQAAFEHARVYWPAPLQVSAPARALLHVREPSDAQHATVAATSAVGDGLLMVLGDLELLWNMAPFAGMQLPDNQALARQLFGVLAPRAHTPRAPAGSAGG